MRLLYRLKLTGNRFMFVDLTMKVRYYRLFAKKNNGF